MFQKCWACFAKDVSLDILFCQAEALNYYLALISTNQSILKLWGLYFCRCQYHFITWRCVNRCVIPFFLDITEANWFFVLFFVINWPQYNLCKLGFTCTLDAEHCCEYSRNKCIKPSFRLGLQRVDSESQTRLKWLKLDWKETSARG